MTPRRSKAMNWVLRVVSLIPRPWSTGDPLQAGVYKLYRNPRSCDTEAWGWPRGRYATLAEAMSAAGHPGPGDWEFYGHCPDDVCVDGPVFWEILAPGVAAEMRALHDAAQGPGAVTA